MKDTKGQLSDLQAKVGKERTTVLENGLEELKISEFCKMGHYN